MLEMQTPLQVFGFVGCTMMWWLALMPHSKRLLIPSPAGASLCEVGLFLGTLPLAQWQLR